MTKECTICAKNGFKNEQVNLDKIGEDPATGKIKWKVTNPDGSEHKHKGGYPPKQALAPILIEIRDLLKQIRDAKTA